jgi:hypothetical protein
MRIEAIIAIIAGIGLVSYTIKEHLIPKYNNLEQKNSKGSCNRFNRNRYNKLSKFI